DGQPDDSDIDVYLVRSTGTPADDAGSPIKPTFQGTDIFDCVKEDVAACAPTILPSTPRFDGYVRDGLLVVPDARFVLSAIEGFEIPTRGTLTAKIERVRETPPSYRLTGGTLAGAMRVDSLLAALSLV